jgi:hypothetical protein
MDSTCVSSSVREKARDIYRESEGRMEGLKDGRLDGVRIGIPIVRHLPFSGPSRPIDVPTRLLPAGNSTGRITDST